MILEKSGGFHAGGDADLKVINLGVDISDRQFVEAVKKYNPQIVCLSALLTTTMNYMQNVIDTLAAEGLRIKLSICWRGSCQ